MVVLYLTFCTAECLYICTYVHTKPLHDYLLCILAQQLMKFMVEYISYASCIVALIGIIIIIIIRTHSLKHMGVVHTTED